jgi:DNA replication protein DnaC
MTQHTTASLDNLPDIPADIVGALRAWAENPRGTMFLHGVPGSGKTWAAYACYNAIRAFKRFMSEGEYLDHRRKRVSGEVTFDIRQGDQAPEVMVLDDLGASKHVTDWALDEICELIRFRHFRGMPTLITANYGLNELKRIVGPRIVSRIAESKLVFEFPKKDLRLCGALQGVTQ